MDDNSCIKPVVNLSLVCDSALETPVFNADIARLCQGIQDYGSLNAAAHHAGIAYSRAWRIVKNAEEALGQKLLIRDGAHGSTLTDEGKRLLEAYDELFLRIESFAHAQVEAEFGKLLR